MLMKYTLNMSKYLIKYVFGIKNYNPMHKLSADTNYLQTKFTLQVRKLKTEYSNTVELWKKKPSVTKYFPLPLKYVEFSDLKWQKMATKNGETNLFKRRFLFLIKLSNIHSLWKNKYKIVFYFYFFYTWLISSDFSDVLVETVMWKHIYGMTVNIWICSNR